jgi:hypothetical protein
VFPSPEVFEDDALRNSLQGEAINLVEGVPQEVKPYSPQTRNT